MGAKRIAAVVAGITAIALPGAATAGQIELKGPALPDKAPGDFLTTFTAMPGEANRLTMSPTPGTGSERTIELEDLGAPLSARAPCFLRDPNRGVCTGSVFAEAFLGDGDDHGSSSGDNRLYGEEGNDVLRGQSVDGGPGGDTLTLTGPGTALTGPGAGVDSVQGSDGNDQIQDAGDGERDRYEGGPGRDRLTYARYAPVTLTVGGAENEDTFSGIEEFWGSGGNDTLIGDGSANWFASGGGLDTMIGGGGPDHLSGGFRVDGGAGNDVIDELGGPGHVVAGGPGDDRIATEGDDRIACGPGRDRLVATLPATVNPVPVPADCELRTLGGGVTVLGRPRRVGRSLLVRVSGRLKVAQTLKATVDPKSVGYTRAPVGYSRSIMHGGRLRIPLNGRGRKAVRRGRTVYLYNEATRRSNRKRTPSIGLTFRVP